MAEQPIYPNWDMHVIRGYLESDKVTLNEHAPGEGHHDPEDYSVISRCPDGCSSNIMEVLKTISIGVPLEIHIKVIPKNAPKYMFP